MNKKKVLLLIIILVIFMLVGLFKSEEDGINFEEVTVNVLENNDAEISVEENIEIKEVGLFKSEEDGINFEEVTVNVLENNDAEISVEENIEIEFVDDLTDLSKEEQKKLDEYFLGQKTFNPSAISEDLKCKDCNLVIISATNVRKNNMSLYGYEKNTTPNIDKFSENALIFENVIAPASWTLPNNISFYTSLFPLEHGIMNRYVNSFLNDNVTSLIDILQKNGYKTVAFTGENDYGVRYGLVSRFEEIIIDMNSRGVGSLNQYGKISSLVSETTDWLKKNKDEKFFLLLQGFDAHCPFNPTEQYSKLFENPIYQKNIDNNNCYVNFEPTSPIIKNNVPFFKVIVLGNVQPKNIDSGIVKIQEGRYGSLEFEIGLEDVEHLKNMYDGEIRQVDNSISKLLQEIENLGLSEKTIIIFMSDHGDLIGEHNRFMRGGPLRGTFYNEVLNIPLVIKNPKFEAKKIDGLAQTVDIMPTILDFLGISAKYQRQGKSLLPLILNNEKVNDYVFSGSIYSPYSNNLFFNSQTNISAVTDGKWKLIREKIQDSSKIDINEYEILNELYNIENDTRELNNLYDKNNSVFKKLQDKLNEWESQFSAE